MTNNHFCYIPQLPFINPRYAVSAKGKQWRVGEIIDIHFMEGTKEQKEFVADTAEQWLKYANLYFNWGASADDSDIRISFRKNMGSWSYIGTDALFIPDDRATMNFGWLDQSVVLHEFGHMLGLHHEHQNPDGGLEWNEEAVIKDLSGPPNNWDEATIRHNVLNKLDVTSVSGTEFDPHSIMLYYFPPHWLKSGNGTRYNYEISETDAKYIESLYPTPNYPR